MSKWGSDLVAHRIVDISQLDTPEPDLSTVIIGDDTSAPQQCSEEPQRTNEKSCNVDKDGATSTAVREISPSMLLDAVAEHDAEKLRQIIENVIQQDRFNEAHEAWLHKCDSDDNTLLHICASAGSAAAQSNNTTQAWEADQWLVTRSITWWPTSSLCYWSHQARLLMGA